MSWQVFFDDHGPVFLHQMWRWGSFKGLFISLNIALFFTQRIVAKLPTLRLN